MTDVLKDRVALVTGGSRGIGAAIVRRLAKDGARVAFTYVASGEQAAGLVKDIADAGGEAIAIVADSADPDAVKRAVAETVARFGRVDILVNNAGILLHGDVASYDLAAFDRMVGVNVKAMFVATQAVLPHMQAGGRIITMGSVVADRSGFPGASVYSMTKSAVAALTRGLARDLGPRGITVNTVQPGPTATDMNPAAGHERLGQLIALGRVGRDDEVASLVAYVAGPESSFITGSALTVDGGYLA